MTRTILGLITLLLAFPARAEEPELAPLVASPAEGPSGDVGPGVAVAVKLGGDVPSLFSGLEPTYQLEIEGGVLLLARKLELDVSLGYSRPPARHTSSDVRLEGADYSWVLTQEIVSLGALVRYRFLDGQRPFNVYVAAGPRLHFLTTRVNGQSGGAELGESVQYTAAPGVAAMFGAELSVGPGRALAELDLSAGPLSGLVTGQTSAGGLGLVIGYRLLF